MEVGLYLTCKKDLWENNSELLLRNGISYEVAHINPSNQVSIDYEPYNKYYCIIFDTDKRSTSGLHYIWDYFYKPNELRQIKLKSIIWKK